MFRSGFSKGEFSPICECPLALLCHFAQTLLSVPTYLSIVTLNLLLSRENGLWFVYEYAILYINLTKEESRDDKDKAKGYARFVHQYSIK